jgi:hypothetical protein
MSTDLKHPIVNMYGIKAATERWSEYETCSMIIADIYSGRKNPEAAIGITATRSIMDRLRKILECTDLKPSDHCYLGYRGFWIKFTAACGLRIETTYYVPARLHPDAIPSHVGRREMLLDVHGDALLYALDQEKKSEEDLRNRVCKIINEDLRKDFKERGLNDGWACSLKSGGCRKRKENLTDWFCSECWTALPEKMRKNLKKINSAVAIAVKGEWSDGLPEQMVQSMIVQDCLDYIDAYRIVKALEEKHNTSQIWSAGPTWRINLDTDPTETYVINKGQ